MTSTLVIPPTIACRTFPIALITPITEAHGQEAISKQVLLTWLQTYWLQSANTMSMKGWIPKKLKAYLYR